MTVLRLRSWGFLSKKAKSESYSSCLMTVLDFNGSWKEEVCLFTSLGLDEEESRYTGSGSESLCLAWNDLDDLFPLLSNFDDSDGAEGGSRKELDLRFMEGDSTSDTVTLRLRTGCFFTPC